MHDEIFVNKNKEIYRQTNNAGGIEGGMSNGEELVLRVAMKPIPTIASGLRTVDYLEKTPTIAAAERSDVCAVKALEIVAEAVVAETVANAVAERLGGDTMAQVINRYNDLP